MVCCHAWDELRRYHSLELHVSSMCQHRFMTFRVQGMPAACIHPILLATALHKSAKPVQEPPGKTPKPQTPKEPMRPVARTSCVRHYMLQDLAKGLALASSTAFIKAWHGLNTSCSREQQATCNLSCGQCPHPKPLRQEGSRVSGAVLWHPA